MKTTYRLDYYPSLLLAWLALATIVTFASLGRALVAAQFTLT
jgi:hypothetical protein